MSVNLPPYMSLEHNKETRKAILSVLDREERKQREMWGMFCFPYHVAAEPSNVVSDSHRNDPRIPQQPHIRRVRRSRCDITTCGGRLQSYSRANSRLGSTRVPRPAIRLPEGWLLASHRARRPAWHESEHTTAYKDSIGRNGKRGGKSICCQDQEVESTGTL